MQIPTNHNDMLSWVTGEHQEYIWKYGWARLSEENIEDICNFGKEVRRRDSRWSEVR